MKNNILSVIELKTENAFYKAVYQLQKDYFKLEVCKTIYAILRRDYSSFCDYVVITYSSIDQNSIEWWTNTIECSLFNYLHTSPFTSKEIKNTILNLSNNRDYQLDKELGNIYAKTTTYSTNEEEVK